MNNKYTIVELKLLDFENFQFKNFENSLNEDAEVILKCRGYKGEFLLGHGQPKDRSKRKFLILKNADIKNADTDYFLQDDTGIYESDGSLTYFLSFPYISHGLEMESRHIYFDFPVNLEDNFIDSYVDQFRDLRGELNKFINSDDFLSYQNKYAISGKILGDKKLKGTYVKIGLQFESKAGPYVLAPASEGPYTAVLEKGLISKTFDMIGSLKSSLSEQFN